MKNLYHNYFISNFFKPGRLVGKGSFSSTPKAELSRHEGNVETLISEGNLQKLKAKRSELIKLKKHDEDLIGGRSLTQSAVKKKVKRYAKMIKNLDAKIKDIEDAEKEKVATKKSATETARKEAEETKIVADVKRLKGKVAEHANKDDKVSYLGVQNEITKKWVNSAPSTNNNPFAHKRYEGALTYARERWKNRAEFKPKKTVKITQVAPAKEVKKPLEKDVKDAMIAPRREMTVKLNKIKSRKKLREEVNKLVAGYNKKIKALDSLVKKEAYRRMITEANGYLLDRAKERMLIPINLVAKVNETIKDKNKVTLFLTEIGKLQGRQYNKKKIAFKNKFLSDSEYSPALVTMAMQKALGFKGGAIDGAIGPKTKARLEKLAGMSSKETAGTSQKLKSALGKKPGATPGATSRDTEVAKIKNPVIDEAVANIDINVDKEQRRKDFKIFKDFVKEQGENPYRKNGQMLFKIAYKEVGGPKEGREQEWVENVYTNVDNLRWRSEEIDFDNLRRKPEKTEKMKKRRDDYAYNTGTYKQLSNHVKAINPKIKKIMGDVVKFPEFDNINANELTKYEKMAYKVKIEIKNPSTKMGKLAKLATNVNWSRATADNKNDYLGYSKSKMEHAIIDEYAKQNNKNVAGVRKNLRA